MLGWKQLARKVDRALTILGDPERTLVLCDNYGQAGAINYYSKNSARAVSFNADYINWFDLSKTYKHVIRIKEYDHNDSTIRSNKKDFEKVFVAGTISDTLAREKGTKIYIFQNAQINLADSLRKYLSEGDPY